MDINTYDADLGGLFNPFQGLAILLSESTTWTVEVYGLMFQLTMHLGHSILILRGGDQKRSGLRGKCPDGD